MTKVSKRKIKSDVNASSTKTKSAKVKKNTDATMTDKTSRDRSEHRRKDAEEEEEEKSSEHKVIRDELKKYRNRSFEQENIINALNARLEELEEKFNSQAQEMATQKEELLTQQQQWETAKKKQKKDRKNDNQPKSLTQTDTNFASHNLFEILDDTQDTEMADADTPPPEDNNSESFLTKLTKKNQKQREEYPQLPMKKKTINAPEPKPTERSNIQASGAVARGAEGKGRIAGKGAKQPLTTATAPKPPRIILMQDIQDTKKILTSELNIDKYTIQQNRNKTTTLKLDSIADYKKANEIFKSTQTMHFTFTPKSEKPKSFVLRGLSNNTEEQEIQKELDEMNIPNVKIVNVRRIITRKSEAENFKIPLFVVQTSPDSIAANLLKIRFLDHVVVHWEPLKKRLYTQCRRCQRLNHVSANCQMPYRCVKCGESHEPGKCKITVNSQRTELFCILCQSYGHPASFSGCPKIKQHLENIEKQKETASNARQNRLHRAYRQVSGDLNFANVVTNQNQTHSQAHNTHIPTYQNNPHTNEFQSAISSLETKLLAMFESLGARMFQIEKKVHENRIFIDSMAEYNQE